MKVNIKIVNDNKDKVLTNKEINIKGIKDPLKKYYYLAMKEYNSDDVEYSDFAFHNASLKANEIIIDALKEYKNKDISKEQYDDYLKLLSAYEPYGYTDDRGDDGLEAIYSYVHKYIPRNLLNDKDFIIRYCTLDERGLSMASEKFRDDEDVVLEAVKRDGFNLEYASDRLKDNKKIVLNSINHYSRAYLEDKFFSPYMFISDRLKKDYEICKTAIKGNLYSLEYISRDVLYDDNFTEPIFTEMFNVKYSEFDNKTNDEIIDLIKGLEKYNNNYFVYLPSSVKTNKDVALFCYKTYERRPRIYDMYIFLTEHLKQDEDIIKRYLINKVRLDKNFLGIKINIDDIINEKYINNIEVLRKVLKLDLDDNVKEYILNKADKDIVEKINKESKKYDISDSEYWINEDFDEGDLPF